MKAALWVWAALQLVVPLYGQADASREGGAAGAKPEAMNSPAAMPKVGLGLTEYFDSRGYETLALFSQVDNLPLGIRLWGFTDLHGNQGHPDGRFRLDRYLMEYRVLLPLRSDWLSSSDEIGGIAEYNDFDGSGNNLVRFGAYYQHRLPLGGDRTGSLQWRLFAAETHSRSRQASVSYSIPLGGRVAISGFADLNFPEQGARRWVVEPQLNVRLYEHLTAVLEFRHNGFEQAGGLEGTGIALGLSLSH